MTSILMLGNGGREHAMALSIKKDDSISLINWAPSINPGIAELCDKVIELPFTKDIDVKQFGEVKYALIGPEYPLVDGIADCLETKGIEVFAPSRRNARIEGDKVYMRQLLAKYNINGNINFIVCSTQQEIIDAIDENYMIAVKPAGLTSGKGVKVWGSHLKTKEMVIEYANKILEKDGVVLLEELITGVEFSVQAIVKKNQLLFFPLVKDYKRAYEDDVGPNTGSMGSCSFADHKLPYVSEENFEEVKEIMTSVIKALSYENGEYKGFIYGQFMLSEDGVKVIEFNARLGDPEAINVLGLMENPLIDIVDSLYREEEVKMRFKAEATVCVYIVPSGYPENPEAGAILDLSPEILDNAIIASIHKENDNYIASKSRSLAVISYAQTIDKARKIAYKNMPRFHDHLRYRNDIGKEFIEND